MELPDYSALDLLFDEYFRPYQVEYLTDWSPKRIVLKARRVGMSWTAAFDVVMTTSGLWEDLGFPVTTHNYSVISKRDTEAQQFIRYCKQWIDVLREDPALRPWVELKVDSKTALTFSKSGRRIQSDTQSEMAGRGQEGHLLKDEAAWYRHAREIVAGADKIPLSDPSRLRITEFSTPNGTSGMGEVFWRKWTDRGQFGDYSRHQVDIHRAIADGFPLTVEEARANCFTDEEYQQEFECAFVAGESEYFERGLIELAVSTPPKRHPDKTIVGIDVASLHDLTAVCVLRVYGGITYLEESYIISGIPYASRDGVQGQEDVVAAILWATRPDAAIIDATGDGGRIYGRLLSKRACKLIPHTFSNAGRRWKNTHVPRVREALESGKLCIANLQPKVYRPGRHHVASRQNAVEFAQQAFADHQYPAVLHDFMRIQRKLTATGTTFDSPRDADGHSDIFWAACMGFSIISDVSERARGQFRQLLDASTAPSASAPGSDFGEYL